MTCRDCAAAAANPWHGLTAGCRGCVARRLARSQAYRQAREAGDMTPEYRAELEAAGLRHSEVTAARKADALARDTK